MTHLRHSTSLRAARLATVLALALGASACASQPRLFPLRDPLWKDTISARSPCLATPRRPRRSPSHISCTPQEYVSSFAWDAADNTLFRPLSRAFAVIPAARPSTPTASTRSLIRPGSPTGSAALRSPSTSSSAAPASRADARSRSGRRREWLIDKGKANGASPGFRIRVPGIGKFMLKADAKEQPERPSAASVIGSTVYHELGFNTSASRSSTSRPRSSSSSPGSNTPTTPV